MFPVTRTCISIEILISLKKLSGRLILPTEPKESIGNWHIFAIRVPRVLRGDVIKRLKTYGIEAAFHYLPLHSSAMGKKLGYRKNDLPICEEVAATLIRLPIYPTLKKTEMDYIAAVIAKSI